MINLTASETANAVESLANAGLFLTEAQFNNTTIGKLTRCGTIDKPTSRNGWYIVKASTDLVTVTFGNNAIDSTAKRHYYINLNQEQRTKRTPAERLALQTLIDNKVKADRAKSAQERQQKASYYVEQFKKAELLNTKHKHAYLTAKQIHELVYLNGCWNIRINGNELLIPFYNDAGAMQGYQSIVQNSVSERSIKRYRGSIGGNHWQYLPENAKYILVAEGFASLFSAWGSLTNWGHDVSIGMVLPFDAGNLKKCADFIVGLNKPIIFLVDRDKSNTGRITAEWLLDNYPTAEISAVIFDDGSESLDANDFYAKYGKLELAELINENLEDQVA